MKGSGSGRGKSCILLDDPHVPWHVQGDRQQREPVVYVRGYATSGEDCFEDAELARHIHQLSLRGRQTLQAAVPKLNGGWAFVVQWPTGELLASVDRLRTIPLFYYHDSNCFAIAGSGAQLAQRYSRPMDVGAQFEFLLFRYVTGSETLYEGIRQLQSGELIQYRPGQQEECSSTRYFRFYPTTISTDDPEALADELAATIQRMFERLRDGLRGKRVVVPLSGGLDSRLVAGMLKRVGIDACLCYTYSFGDQSAEEVQFSRQVAEALGFPWRCVSYSPEVWARLNRSGTFRQIVRYGCKGVSHPNVHDFPAVVQLAEGGLGGDETVFFPGHTGDMISGGHIPSDYPDILAGTLSPADHVLRTHGRALWDDPSPLMGARSAQGLREKTCALAAPPPGAAHEDPVACCDMWNAEQRQAKYIINSVRTYEFVGSQWRTLWDYELMDFFLRVPYELRYGQALYLDCLRRKIFVGDLAELAAIPVAKHGPLKLLSFTRRPARRTSPITRWLEVMKRQTRRQLLKAGVARRHIAKLDTNQLARILLVGLGIPDRRISLAGALDRVGAFEDLAPEIQQALKPRLKFNLDSLRLAGVYGTIVLAEMAKDAHSK